MAIQIFEERKPILFLVPQSDETATSCCPCQELRKKIDSSKAETSVFQSKVL